MADLQRPDTAAAFAAVLAEAGVRLPLRLCVTDVGVILDEDGRDVVTIDVNGERPDEEADRIAFCIVLAVNAFGGLKPEERANV